MPGFSVFRAAAKIRYGIEAAHLHPGGDRGAVGGGHRNIEAAVCVQQSRVVPVQPEPFSVAEEHRNARAVLAGVENLLRLVTGGIKAVLTRSHLDALARPEVQPVLTRRDRKSVV